MDYETIFRIIVDGAIVITAIAAIYIAVKQNSIAREHNRLSVRPLLSLSWCMKEDGRMGAKLSNRGLGPARVTGVNIQFEGKDYEMRLDALRDIIRRLGIDDLEWRFSSISPSTILRPHQEEWLVWRKVRKDDSGTRTRVGDAFLGVALKINYQCLYESEHEYERTFYSRH